MDGIQSAMSIVGYIGVVMSIVSAGAPAGPVVALIRFLKLFFRLRLINTNFGDLLDFFMSSLGEMMKTSNYAFSDLDRTYFVRSRAKLSEHKISIFASFVLYDKILIYLVSSISNPRCSSSSQSPPRASSGS